MRLAPHPRFLCMWKGLGVVINTGHLLNWEDCVTSCGIR